MCGLGSLRNRKTRTARGKPAGGLGLYLPSPFLMYAVYWLMRNKYIIKIDTAAVG